MDPTPTPGRISFEDLLNSPLFKQVLFDVQTEECERLLEDMQQKKIPLTPGSGGRYCLGNGKHSGVEIQCDECDYFICCFDKKMCNKCLKENGICEMNARYLA